MEPKSQQLSRTVRLALLAILAALTTVLTRVIQIPLLPTSGYLNFGDIGVLFAGLLLGPIGGVAGGVGSALADLMSPYFYYAPLTLVVKGLEGAIAGFIFRSNRMLPRTGIRLVLALVCGSTAMVLGYLVGETTMGGLLVGWLPSFANALTEVPFNILQVVVGSIIAPLALTAAKLVSLAWVSHPDG
jgi:uncharacterized membrane protein